LGAAFSELEKNALRRVLGVRFTVEDLRRMADEPSVIVLPQCSHQLYERIGAEHPGASVITIDSDDTGPWDPAVHLVEAGSGRCSTWLGRDGLAEALRSVDASESSSSGPKADELPW
jgi:hypothetical protein